MTTYTITEVIVYEVEADTEDEALETFLQSDAQYEEFGIAIESRDIEPA